jgi:PPOX class probable F420-dependent enzyme
MNTYLINALQHSRLIYLTTYSQSGRSGTVPVWFMFHQEQLYFTTRRSTVKARRIRLNPRVTVHIGTSDGPVFTGQAFWVDNEPEIKTLLLQTYRRKYWYLWWLFRFRIRRELHSGEELIIRIIPDKAEET